MKVRAFAKINTHLHVGRLRENGLHEISSRIRMISLCDEIALTPADELSVECSVGELSGENNLAWKAMRLLSEAIPLPNYRIFIEKRIPMQAGLGGGSSDSAAVLLAAVRASKIELPGSLLDDIALACGTDALFFVRKLACADVAGTGDLITPCGQDAPMWIVLAKPEVGSPTKDAYKRLDAAAERGAFANEFDAVACGESLALKNRLLEEGAKEAMLCGSGSAVFGVFESQSDSERVATALSQERIWSKAERTLTQKEVDEEWTL